MTELVERVACAICGDKCGCDGRPIPKFAPCRMKKVQARAAVMETLRGMMEPSEAMDLAGDNSFQWGGPTGNEWLEAADSTACWKAMLTQKIKEVEGD